MKNRHILLILTVIVFVVALVFAWPATDINLFGKKINWDGLNLKTITNDKKQGELQFANNYDIRDGVSYTYQIDLSTKEDLHIANGNEEVQQSTETAEPKPLDQQKANDFVRSQANIFATRLDYYGIRDFDLEWYIDSDQELANIELAIAEVKSEYAQSIMELLAAQGNMAIWTQDPDYVASEELDTESYSYLDGMVPSQIISDDIYSIESVLSGKASVMALYTGQATMDAYGFKVTFKKEAESKLLEMMQIENQKTSILVIDGQPIGTRSWEIENLGGDSKPVMYLSSIISNTFAVDNAVEATFRAGELDQDLSLVSSQVQTPTLGQTYEWDFKLSVLISIVAVMIMTLIMYKKYGLIIVSDMLMNVVAMLFVLKLFQAVLSLSLIAGSMVALIFVLLTKISVVSKLSEDRDSSYKNLSIFMIDYFKKLRRTYLLLILTFPLFYISGMFELVQFSLALSMSLVLEILITYILQSIIIPSIYFFKVPHVKIDPIAKTK